MLTLRRLWLWQQIKALKMAVVTVVREPPEQGKKNILDVLIFQKTIVCYKRSHRYKNWAGSMFMRFGASCCPTWDPSNWLSRHVPTIVSFWMKSRPPNENEKLLRTASEEEVFAKRPKRKVRKRHKSKEETTAADVHHQTDAISKQTADVEGLTRMENSESSSTICSETSQRKRRSRREQAALAAKSSRGGGKSGYTAANLRRYAAGKKEQATSNAIQDQAPPAKPITTKLKGEA